jgi:outer membrane murein-binding lipoprotein Lpp
MKKTAIIGLLALFALTTVMFAAPALSTSDSRQVTIKSLARQVRALRAQVNTLRGQVAAAQSTASAAQGTANTAQATAQKLDGCLNTALPLTRYEDYVGSDAAAIFTNYDPDVLGYVPNVVTGTFGFVRGLDVTNTGATPNYYVALVEPSCAGGYRLAQQGAQSHAR